MTTAAALFFSRIPEDLNRLIMFRSVQLWLLYLATIQSVSGAHRFPFRGGLFFAYLGFSALFVPFFPNGAGALLAVMSLFRSQL